MAGIYIHIPFCRKACHYCNFHFSTSFKKKDELVGALIREISLQAAYLQGEVIETVYFGGGTPSVLPTQDITTMMESIQNLHPVAGEAEITLEANPDDLTLEKLTEWQIAGINRLSIGIQAFQDDLLTAWNRSHDAEQAIESIGLAQQAGIKNITADLIYGVPGLSDKDWISNIKRLIASGISHISSYALTVETGTALFHQIKKGITASPDDDQANRQYTILQEILAAHGFLQYEVSNFAKPGFESRHNTSYWSGSHYLGIGPSAHSFNGLARQWNVSNNIKYIDSITAGMVPYEKEDLTDIQRYNELVMTGLRTTYGIDMLKINALGEKFSSYLDQQIKTYAGNQRVIKNELGNWILSTENYFFADGIAADLFFTG